DRDRSRRDPDRDFDRRRDRKSPPPSRRSEERSEEVQASSEPPVKKKKDDLDSVLTRTGGAYIPPAKLRMMQEQITDKSRGQLARSVLLAQSASPIFTHVYAAVVAIINTKFPQIGELILKRLILNFRKGYRRNDKKLCLTSSKFVAHLINQNVAHEVLALEMLTLLLERPTDDSVEVSIGFLKESGLKLTQVTPRGINAIFERLRNILHESEIDKRVQYMIEVMFAVRKDGFKDHPVIPEGLDLVEEEDQFTHMLPLEDDYNPEDVLNVFKMDPSFLENEEKYKTIKREILDEGDSGSEGEEGGSDDDSDDEDDDNAEEAGEEGEKITIHDKTEINLVSFRRTIYLAIQSSHELCNMILDCCAQQRTYEKFFGLLAGRFCLLKKEYMESFESIFKEQYETIHRLETNKLRNVAKMFAHLLYTDSLPWSVKRTLQPFFEGLLPMDNPKNTRFAINFFTSIGLGGLTDELREHLKNAPKMIMTQKQNVESSDSSSSESASSSSESSDSSSSESSSSDSDSRRRKKTSKKVKSKEKTSRKEKSKEKTNKTSSRKESSEERQKEKRHKERPDSRQSSRSDKNSKHSSHSRSSRR
ncbi:hypothetical protein GDO78_002678, partial [Eleutherodactylus coqui]